MDKNEPLFDVELLEMIPYLIKLSKKKVNLVIIGVTKVVAGCFSRNKCIKRNLLLGILYWL